MAGRILLVDDEPRILDGLRRSLRGRYPVETAESGAEGLEILNGAALGPDPFAVVVSDMMMPGMNGAQFLIRAREVVPDASLMILSGQADLTSTIAAVNQANLFRFLTKPIEPDELTAALDAGLRQYLLITSERELLGKTVRGAVDVLTEVLSLASPVASRRTDRVRTLVGAASTLLRVDGQDWRLPLAAMLSQLGCAAVPHEVLDQVETGGDLELTPAEHQVFSRHPEVARRLLERIPRLEEVAEWIGEQSVGLPTDLPASTPRPGESEDLSRQILTCAVAMLDGLDSGREPAEMARRLAETRRWSQRVVEAVTVGTKQLKAKGVLREVTVDHVRPGMVLDEDVLTVTEMVLLRKGERMTEVSCARLVNFHHSVGLVEPIRVIIGLPAMAAAPA